MTDDIEDQKDPPQDTEFVFMCDSCVICIQFVMDMFNNIFN